MNLFYSNEPLNLNNFDLTRHSIFLAGPTPRSKDVRSWRPEALDILRALKYDGQVIIPEHKGFESRFSAEEFENLYLNQCEWEDFGLEHAVKIVFWVPRDLDIFPAFTTNVEFGRYVNSGRVIYGRPPNAPKNKYLDWLYAKYNKLPIHKTLFNTLVSSI